MTARARRQQPRPALRGAIVVDRKSVDRRAGRAILGTSAAALNGRPGAATTAKAPVAPVVAVSRHGERPRRLAGERATDAHPRRAPREDSTPSRPSAGSPSRRTPNARGSPSASRSGSEPLSFVVNCRRGSRAPVRLTTTCRNDAAAALKEICPARSGELGPMTVTCPREDGLDRRGAPVDSGVGSFRNPSRSTHRVTEGYGNGDAEGHRGARAVRRASGPFHGERSRVATDAF